MPRYEFELTRRQTDYRRIEVNAPDLKAARKKAMQLARNDRDPQPWEEAGDWCDSMVGRPRIVGQRILDEDDNG